MGSVFKRGDNWVIEYKKPNSRPRRESIGKIGIVTKSMAKEILRIREQQIKLGQYEMLQVDIPTIAQFTDEYIRHIKDVKQNRSWKLAVNQLKRLETFFDSKKLSEISSVDIDDYKLYRLKQVKHATINRELACLSHLFNLAKRQKKFFGENPVSISKLLPEHNQVERILTKDEEDKLLESSSLALKAIIQCALYTGMRKNEILSLKWDNVDLNKKLITLEHTNTKNKKMRRIPINSALRKILLELKLKVGSSNYVFLSSKGFPYKRHDSLKQAYTGACRRAKIKGLRFHDLRHTAATRMIESGASIVAVSRILGHSDLKTTMRYAHPEDTLKDAVESLATYNTDYFTDKSTDLVKSENRESYISP